MEVTRSFLASIVESSDDAIIGINLEGRIASWNTGAQDVYGYAPEEARGQWIDILVLPERTDEILQILKRIQRGERVKHFSTMHLRKDGQVIYVSLSVSPILDLFGRIVGASAISRDITQRIRAEELLREAEEKYRLVFSAESDAIILFDAETQHISTFNDAALRLYGYNHEEFQQMTLKDLSADPEEAMQDVYQRLKKKTNHIPLAYHRKKDGSTFSAEMSAGSFMWKGRRMLVVIVRDITERLRTEELKHSLAMAKEVQYHLLPQAAPQLKGVDIYAQSISSDEIGGDYYDFFLQNPVGGLLEFAVGDVSGHGIGAALLMAMAKGVLRTGAEHYRSDLEELFFVLNNCLARNSEESFFMTLFFGQLDPKTRAFRWNSAGHGPVFWYQCRRERICELPTTGIPLGVIEDTVFKASEPIVLEPGDILLVGTDGIWEARNVKGEMYDTRRLRQVLATWSEKPSRNIYRAVMDKVTAFCSGVEQQDDMTLMVVKVLE